MGGRILICNGLVLGGIGGLVALGGEIQAQTLLPRAPEAVKELEATAAISPTAPAVARLASAYLERDQPGLATAVIEKAPQEVQRQPEVGQLHARALYGRGKAREALAVARDAYDRCDGERPCAPWLVAKTSQQVAFLEQVVAAGIEDPQANPEATLAAYERSTREVHLVAMR